MRALSTFFDSLFGCNRRIEAKLDRILNLQENTMGQLEDLVAALDAETNAVAARIDKLSADLQAAIADGVAPKPETLASLAAISQRLKTLGTDPAAPIPAPEPTDPPAPPPAPEPAPEEPPTA